jgi:hypothetical protein
MLAVSPGQERSLAEYDALLAAADLRRVAVLSRNSHKVSSRPSPHEPAARLVSSCAWSHTRMDTETTSGRFRDYTSTWNEHRFEGIASYYAERIVINGERRTRGCIPRG